jgi:hypothetical protein
MSFCIFYGPQNKEQFFPFVELTDYSLKPRDFVFTARYELMI